MTVNHPLSEAQRQVLLQLAATAAPSGLAYSTLLAAVLAPVLPQDLRAARASLSRTLARLARRGLVVVERAGRGRLVRLTPAGAELARGLHAPDAYAAPPPPALPRRAAKPVCARCLARLEAPGAPCGRCAEVRP